jgi:hypothetical protein
MNSREAVAFLTPWRTLHLVAAALCARVPRNLQIDGDLENSFNSQERRALTCLHLLRLARAGWEEEANWQLSTGEAYVYEPSVLDLLTPSESRDLRLFADRWLELARHILQESVDALYEAFELLAGELFSNRAFSIGDTVLCSLQVDESFRVDEHTAEIEQGIGSDRVLQRRAYSGGSAMGPFVRRCLLAFESLPFEAVVRLHGKISQQLTTGQGAQHLNVIDACSDTIAVRRAAHRAVRSMVVGCGQPHPQDMQLLRDSKDPAAELFRWIDAVRRNNINGASLALRRYYDLAVARCSGGMHDSGPQEAAIAMASMLAHMGQPLPAMIALEESIRVAQQTGDYVSLTKALAWMSRLTADEHQRLRLLYASRERSPKHSQERMLSHLQIAQTILNMNFPLTSDRAAKEQKWLRVLEHITRASKAMVNPSVDMHLVFAAMHSLAILSGQPATLRESFTKMRLETLVAHTGSWISENEYPEMGSPQAMTTESELHRLSERGMNAGLDKQETELDRLQNQMESQLPDERQKAVAGRASSTSGAQNLGDNYLATHPIVTPTEHFARALCAYSADTLMRHGILRGMWRAARPLLNTCTLVRNSDESPESSPVLRILHYRLTRLLFEFSMARQEMRIAAVALERLMAYVPPSFPGKLQGLSGNSTSLDILNMMLDVLECQSRYWLAREQVDEALSCAERYAMAASSWAASGCRSRLVEALLLQVECHLCAETYSQALAAALASISLAESIGDEPRRFRGITAMSQVRLAMKAVDHVEWLLLSAESCSQPEGKLSSSKKLPLWQELVHDESPMSRLERAKVWMLLGGLRLAQMGRGQEFDLRGATSCFEHAFRLADTCAMQVEALDALLHVRCSREDQDVASKLERVLHNAKKLEAGWVSAFLVSSSLEWEDHLRSYFRQSTEELQDIR